MKITIYNRSDNSEIFSCSCEENTIKKTVEKAVEKNANLRGANLCGANLQYANLQDANLQDANLQDADLRGANLQGANLQDADLQGAYLRDADLQGANLQGAKNTELTIAKTRILPEGDIIGYKMASNKIVKLLIPKEAKRSSAFGRKCRAEYAIVLEIDGGEAVHSDFDSSFYYKVGENVIPKAPFCDDFTKECESGIHFFITRIEAENY
jgi:hypothetical protein